MQLKKNIAISETGFLFDPSTGDSYNLNPVGQEILLMIKEGKPREQITKIITDKYDVEEVAFGQYFYDFISMLRLYQIIDDNGQE